MSSPAVVADAPAARPLPSFERTWQSRPGFVGWLAEVNNQPIGIRFMVTAFAFFAVGGVLALLLRAQLTVSEANVLGPEFYNQAFTMHGSTMMYLFAVPFLEGLALYLLPLLVGSRDVAYPRMSAFGYWCYLFGGLLFYSGFLVGAVPDSGWFAYVPLSGPRYAGLGSDVWLLGLTLVEVAGITAAIEIVVTILKFRAPGMALSKMPLFVWAVLVAGVMIIFAFTTLLTATVLLELDRTAGTRFFDPHRGGNVLLWQHLFWFFGHPEVYIIFLPATGVVSAVVGVAARRAVAGYTLVVVAMMVMGFLSFGLWVHHMFATGLPELSKTFFTAASLMIAVASGIQVFAWIATLWGSRPAWSLPALWVYGFLFLFVLGGLTGVMVAVVPFDVQVHDTYFVVAHLHYVLIGGVVFPVFAAVYLWWPKATGHMPGERLGRWAFWLTFAGFNLAFFPMHVMGMLGMPRRVYTYPRALQLDAYNVAATAGAVLLAAGFAAIVWNLTASLFRGRRAGDNPWNGDTLEWSVSSPPPPYSFRAPPVVGSRHPAWTGPPEDAPEPKVRASAALDSRPEAWRGTLVTDALDALPQSVQWLPGPTLVPLFAAIALLAAAVGVLIKAYILAAVGAVALVVALVAWLRPREEVIALQRDDPVGPASGLPVVTTGHRSTVWWGMIGLVTTMGVSLAALVYAYFYLRLLSPEWPQGGIAKPALLWPAVVFGVLLLAGAAQAFAGWSFRTGWRLGTLVAAGKVLLFGVAAVAGLVALVATLPFPATDTAYGSIFMVLLAAVAVTAGVGVALQIALLFRLPAHADDRDGFTGLQVQITGVYWAFAAAAGLVVFAVLYLSPHVL